MAKFGIAGMNLKFVLLVAILVTTQLTSVHGILWEVVPAIASVVAALLKAFVPGKGRVVEVHNDGSHDAHLWCASKQDRIGGPEGVWVRPGQKLAWGFHAVTATQFWCTLDWNNQRVGWDVYVGNWKDAPNPAVWHIRNDGIYDDWRNRKWRDLH